MKEKGSASTGECKHAGHATNGAWGKDSRGSGYGDVRNTGFFWKVHYRAEAGRCRDLMYIASVLFSLIKPVLLVVLDSGTWAVVFLQMGVVSGWMLDWGLIKFDVLQQLDCVIVIAIVARCDDINMEKKGDNEGRMLRLRLSWACRKLAGCP